MGRFDCNSSVLASFNSNDNGSFTFKVMFSFLYHWQDFCRTWLYASNTPDVLWDTGTAYLSRESEFTSRFLVGSVLLIFLVFFCVVLLCVFTFWVPSCNCNIRDDFRIITMFGLSWPTFVCMRARILFTLFVFVYV